jgi:pimeloyl-ACP methyl ester carboxylesterase
MGKLHVFPVRTPAVVDDSVRISQAETSVLGTTIFHEEAGEGRPLVLLHWLNDSHRTWRRVLPELARTRRVLMPDLPGCGLSGRPDACYSLDWQARVMNAWLDQLGIDSADLVGHSYGGGVAQYMLLFNAARIRRLALVASGGLGRQVAFELRLASIPRVVELFGQPFMGPIAARALRAVGGVIGDEEARWVTEVNCRPGTARAFARTVRDVIDWRGQRRNFLDRASEVHTFPPVALFWGTKDRVIPHAHAYSTLATMKGAQLTTFEGCGHFPHHQCPESFVRALQQILDDPHASPVRCDFGTTVAEAGQPQQVAG